MTDARDPSAFVIETPRLSLSLPSLDTAERIADYHARNRAFLAPYEPPRPTAFFTRAFWIDRVAVLHEEARQGTSVRWVLMDKLHPDRPIVGTCSLTQIARGPSQNAIVGYALDREREGQGLMREALGAVIGFAFGPLGLKRLMANYLPDNERSARLLKHLGFVIEGYGRELVFINGAWRDHVMTALLNPDPQAVVSPGA